VRGYLTSTLARLSFAILAGALFLAAILVQGWVSGDPAKLQARDRLTEELEGQVSLLLEQRSEIEAAHQRELDVIYGWLDKVAIPRETILRTARLDASGWSHCDFDRCYAEATLGKDGWNVACGFDGCSLEPPAILHYVLDPLTGKILSRSVEEQFESNQ
jgi:hypothetical protein